MAGPPEKTPWWKSVWAWLGVGLLLLGGVVDVAGFIDLVEPLAGGVVDAARWLYPFWIVVGLVVLVAVLAFMVKTLRRRLSTAGASATAAGQRAEEAERRATEAEQGTDPERVAHDSRRLKAVRQLASRGDIDYWRDVDFGGKWYGTKTRPLIMLFEEHDSVEDRFLDPDLERLRADVVAGARELMSGTAKWGGPSRGGGPGLYDLGDLDEMGVFDKHHQERFEKQWEDHREELAKRADRLVEAYDALMAEAQQRLPSAFDDDLAA